MPARRALIVSAPRRPAHAWAGARRARLLLLLIVAAWTRAVHADEPVASYIFPAGAQRGTTVTVRIGGLNLHETPRLIWHGDEVTAPAQLQRSAHPIWFEGPLIPLPDSQRQEDYPVDYDATLTVAPDTATGLQRWRVGTSQGITRSLPFVIGELPEIVEAETDGRPLPTLVTLPVTINGRIFPRADIDLWTFDAIAGETIVGEIHAARIESLLDARLSIRGPDGRPLVENDDAVGKDPRVVFTVPQTGRYTLAVSDAQDAGLQRDVYRLTLTRGPWVAAVYPLGGRRGSTIPLELIGRDVAAVPQPFAIPSDSAELLMTPGSSRHWIATSDLEEHLETEPNDATEAAKSVPLNVVLNGRIQSPGDVDHWRFEVTAGQTLEFSVDAAALGSPLDAVLTIRDSHGKVLAEADDGPNGVVDPQLTWSPPAAGTYFVSLADRYSGRGDARFGYRLTLRTAASLAPSATLRLPTDGLSVPRGGEAKLKIAVERRHGFNGPLKLSADQLPAGVSVAEVTVAPNQKDGTLIFKAAGDAPIQSAAVIVRGRGEQDGQPVEAVATMERLAPDDLPRTGLHVAVALPTPFKVLGEFETKYAPRGSTFVRKYRIERNGFTGPLQVRLADRQARHLQGVTGPVIEVPADVNEFTYPVQLPPWMEIGRTSRTCVMASGLMTLEDGSRHVVSFSSQEQNNQIIVLVDPGRLSLQLAEPTLLAEPGSTVRVPFTVQRGVDLAGPVRVELVVPPHIRGMSCQPVELSAETDLGELTIQFSAPAVGPFNQPLIVRAAVKHNEVLTTAEAGLEIIATTADRE